MRLVSLVPTGTKIDFLRWRKHTVAGSAFLCVLSLILYFAVGLNYGVDFAGGIMIEVRTPQAANISEMRSKLAGLGFDAEIQEFGQPNDVLIRIPAQEGDEAAQTRAIEEIRAALGPGVEYRRVEFVGPKVGAELVTNGIIATVLSLLAIAAYLWVRFDWQFGLAGIAALLHDVLATIGMFALTGLEFNLTSLAAVLAIAGYSINDTVVIFDRVRENLRKYKQLGLVELVNLSVNETLSRTILTSMSTLLAMICLVAFGGPVIRGFSIAMLFGIIIGVYSTIYVAAPLVIYFGLKRSGRLVGEETPSGAAQERMP